MYMYNYKGKLFAQVEKYYQSNKFDFDIRDPQLTLESKQTDGDNIIKIYKQTATIFSGIYNILGVYDMGVSMWYWSYILDYMDQSLCTSKDVITNIRNFCRNGQLDKPNIEDVVFRTSNDSIYMSSINNILPLIKILLYFTKSSDYLLVYYENNAMQLYHGQPNVGPIYVVIIKNILRIL